MNSTLKSLLFWAALLLLGVLIWNFSTKFQTHERQASFTEFMQWVDSGSVSRNQPNSGSVTFIESFN